MVKSLFALLEHRLSAELSSKQPRIAEHAVREATAALLVEMARADFDFDITERIEVERIFKGVYGLTDSETTRLLKLAEVEVDTSISLDQFTRVLDHKLSREQKFHVIELLWEVAFADGRVDKYEEYLLRKVNDLLHLSHKEFIRAKLKVAEKTKGHRQR